MKVRDWWREISILGAITVIVVVMGMLAGGSVREIGITLCMCVSSAAVGYFTNNLSRVK